MKSVLKYSGAKNRIADWICSYIPEHNVYLEPYAGSLAVLLHKERCHIETVNDLNEDVVNFFRVLRDQPNALRKVISLTPYSRLEYERAYEETEYDLEKARRFCVRCWMGFGCSNRYRNGFKTGQQSGSPDPAGAWSLLPNTMLQAADRLRGVQIENLPATELINRYDTADVFIYADPPYVPDKRKKYLYKNEMDNTDHEALLAQLLRHPGKVMISGYENDLYNDMLKGWEKAQKETCGECGVKRKETLWMNFEIDRQISLFEGGIQ